MSTSLSTISARNAHSSSKIVKRALKLDAPNVWILLLWMEVNAFLAEISVRVVRGAPIGTFARSVSQMHIISMLRCATFARQACRTAEHAKTKTIVTPANKISIMLTTKQANV